MTPQTLPTAAEKALADKDRQWRRYRAQKKAQIEQLFAEPVYGERLRKFNATLGHFGIEHADLMVAYVASCAKNWLRTAPEDIRFCALQMVSHRVQRIRARAGLVVFDDPLEGEPDDVFRLCKRELML
jgi:hypothetical protein